MRKIMKIKLSGTALKWIALFTMICDHFAAAVFLMYTSSYGGNGESFAHADVIYQILRGIGRTAFPIYCFLLVEGFCHTRNLSKYAWRLLLFAIASEVPFDLALFGRNFHWGYQNVYWTLLLGLLAIAGIKLALTYVDTANPPSEDGESENSGERKNIRILKASIQVEITLLFMLIAWLCKTDYSYFGVLLIVVLYLLRNQPIFREFAGFLCMCWEPWCFPGFLLMTTYSGKRGKHGLKYFFYVMYPAHLLLFYFLRKYLLTTL